MVQIFIVPLLIKTQVCRHPAKVPTKEFFINLKIFYQDLILQCDVSLIDLDFLYLGNGKVLTSNVQFTISQTLLLPPPH